MVTNKDLVKDFASGAAEISAEIFMLLGKITTQSDATPKSPLSVLHKYTDNLAKSADIAGLVPVAEYLRETDKVFSAIKNKKLEVSQPLASSMRRVSEKFAKIVTAIYKNSGDFDKNLEDEVNFLKKTIIDIQNGIFLAAQTESSQEEDDEEDDDVEEELSAVDAELIPDFVADTREHISSAEENFLILSQKGYKKDVVDTTYRNIHSIKGNCGFIHFYQLQNLCHLMETIMGGMREKTIKVTNDNVSFLLDYLDVVKTTVSNVGDGGKGTVKGLKKLTTKAQNKFPEAFGIEVPKVEVKVEIKETAPQKKEEIKVEKPQEKAPEEIKVEEIKKEEPKSVAQTDSVALQAEKESPKEEIKKEDIKKEEPKPQPDAKKQDVKPVKSVIKDAAQIKEEMEQLIVTDDMKQNFISDSNEQLMAAEEAFLSLEKNGYDQEIMNNAYRYIHSFKGNSGFMQLEDFKLLGHTMETIMQFMKDQKIPVNGDSISFLLSFLDILRNGIANFEQGSSVLIPDAEEHKKRAIQMFPQCFNAGNSSSVKAAKVATAKADEAALDLITANSGDTIRKKQDLRVDLYKLENIINLVGELIISESMVTRNPVITSVSNEGLAKSIHQLRRICNDLQDASMSLRMVSVSGLFKKMARLVHDLSNVTHKKINLITIGEDTEVDKTVSELINDPLVHIVRNCCDHGVESTQERVAAGKSETGTVTISSEHRNGAVWISVKDDGHGLNRKKILAKAIEKGMTSPDAQLSDNDVWQFILQPGFSTAETISDISGRGVGMDVVKKNVEDLHGQIYINTKEGKGTEFTIRIPLTLAIIDGMIVRVIESLYIIPTLAIRQNLRYNREDITYSPEHEEILKFQDKLIPVVRVGNLFSSEYNEKSEDGILVVVEEGDFLVALFVDDIVGQQQIVIKGLSEYVKKSRGTSGCTILGGGEVALILDLKRLTDMAYEKAFKSQKIPASKFHLPQNQV